MHLGTTFQLFFDGRPRWVFEEYFYNIHYPLRRVDYWFCVDLILKIASDGCFYAYFPLLFFSHGYVSLFWGLRFRLREFVFSVYIVHSVVVSILSLLLLILLSLLLFLLVLLVITIIILALINWFITVLMLSLLLVYYQFLLENSNLVQFVPRTTLSLAL